ncbi:hypothetical protein [Lignipirellula cremea]|uniref:Uncharacterized protein n=1 Tax=Lignipirellula cremea TaxID=2528010 RepID=A0A518E353_9BACT|nr:hypothetical protein [Lignipirellula cremea]QDU98518.1 hypothetical protein Pla8534_63870 [Lignipirellula cremea]
MAFIFIASLSIPFVILAVLMVLCVMEVLVHGPTALTAATVAPERTPARPAVSRMHGAAIFSQSLTADSGWAIH